MAEQRKKRPRSQRRREYADGEPRKTRTAEENAVRARAIREVKAEMKAKGYEIVRKADIQRDLNHSPRSSLWKRAHGLDKRCRGDNLEGKRCRLLALAEGLEIEGELTSGNYCLRHEDKIGSSSWRRFRQEGNGVVQLPRRISPTELAAMAFERAPYYLLKPYLRTLGYDMDKETGELEELPEGGAKIVGFSREGVARVSKHDNLELQVRVAEKLADRFYGKPRTAVTLDGLANGAVIVTMPNDPEHYNSVARVLIETGAVPPANGNGNGNGHVDPPTIEGEIVGEETLDQ